MHRTPGDRHWAILVTLFAGRNKAAAAPCQQTKLLPYFSQSGMHKAHVRLQDMGSEAQPPYLQTLLSSNPAILACYNAGQEI